MRNTTMTRSLFYVGILTAGLAVFSGGTALAQVRDADCFSGACRGSTGIPECPKDFKEVGFVTYANHHANKTQDCVTVVSCTNFSDESIVIDCRFYHGFNAIPAGGGPQDALCNAVNRRPIGVGDTSECATDADPEARAGGFFLAADGNCPAFEGKGLVCVKGGNPKKIVCHAHLSCGNGATLEDISFIAERP